MPTSQELLDVLQALAADLPAHLNAYHAAVLTEAAQRDAQITTLKAANQQLLNQIAELTRPKERKPVVSVRELRNTSQALITLDATPSATKDKIGREMILLAKRLKFNAVRFMRNVQEVAGDLALLPDNPRNLTALTKSQGLLWFADSIDALVTRLTDAQLKTYCANLKQAGAVAIYWNDADRQAIKATLPEMLRRVRLVSDLPQIASLTATANLDTYGRMFDHVEIQTFGTFAEFQNYVLSAADVLCIDGQSSVSTGYLDNILRLPALIQRSNIAVYALYDVNTRWTDNDPISLRYQSFLEKWNGAAV